MAMRVMSLSNTLALVARLQSVTASNTLSFLLLFFFHYCY
jgi:hypothetical protein